MTTNRHDIPAPIGQSEKEPLVAKDMAEAEFDRFTDAMGLLVDTSAMDAEDRTAFDKHVARITHSIQSGSLVINDEGKAVYTPCRPDSKYQEAITFNERSGVSLMAMDGKKKNYDVAKTYAVMGEMCKLHPSTFAGLVGPDIKTCEALFTLLMD